MRNAKIEKNSWVSWSVDEIKLLKKLYPIEGAQSIADKLGRSLKAVKSKAASIGLKKEGARPWSNQEIALLKKLYLKNSPRDIANKLGRTHFAVAVKAYKLGLTEKPHEWSKRELNLLKKLYPNKTAQEIANQIRKTVRAKRKKIFDLNLTKRLRYEDCHRIVNGRKQKLCRKCKRWKAEREFYKDRSQKDGLIGYCKKCSSRAAKEYRMRTLAIMDYEIITKRDYSYAGVLQ
jgi:hypothetical protein